MAQTARAMAPLLQPPGINPHATLVTLFLNAVHEIHHRFKDDPKLLVSELKRVMQYRRSKLRHRDVNDAEGGLNVAATDSVRDGDRYFDMYVSESAPMRRSQDPNNLTIGRYMRELGFTEIERHFRLKMQKKHNIIDKWPFKIRLEPHQRGAEDAFAALLASDVSGTERYVEWKRTS